MARPATDGTGRCALVVDDDRAVAAVLGAFLTRLGVEAIIAGGRDDGERRLAERDDWTLVVTDLQLTVNEQAEGLALLRKARERCPQACIILVSGSPGSNIAEVARHNGADHFLAKPVSFAAFRACVGPWLRERPPPA